MLGQALLNVRLLLPLLLFSIVTAQPRPGANLVPAEFDSHGNLVRVYPPDVLNQAANKFPAFGGSRTFGKGDKILGQRIWTWANSNSGRFDYKSDQAYAVFDASLVDNGDKDPEVPKNELGNIKYFEQYKTGVALTSSDGQQGAVFKDIYLNEKVTVFGILGQTDQGYPAVTVTEYDYALTAFAAVKAWTNYLRRAGPEIMGDGLKSMIIPLSEDSKKVVQEVFRQRPEAGSPDYRVWRDPNSVHFNRLLDLPETWVPLIASTLEPSMFRTDLRAIDLKHLGPLPEDDSEECSEEYDIRWLKFIT